MSGSSRAETADRRRSLQGVQLTQLQDEVVDTAHSQSQFDPSVFARLLLHDIDDVHAAIRDLIDRGLLERAEGDTYRLTDQGEAVHRAQEQAHRATVVRLSSSW